MTARLIPWWKKVRAALRRRRLNRDLTALVKAEETLISVSNDLPHVLLENRRLQGEIKGQLVRFTANA